MKVQRSVFCSMVLIFEFLLILMGCGGGGCPTLSRTGKQQCLWHIKRKRKRQRDQRTMHWKVEPN